MILKRANSRKNCLKSIKNITRKTLVHFLNSIGWNSFNKCKQYAKLRRVFGGLPIRQNDGKGFTMNALTLLNMHHTNTNIHYFVVR